MIFFFWTGKTYFLYQKNCEYKNSIQFSGPWKGFLSNNAGGTLGGISSGQNIIVKMALKPTSSILVPGSTVTTKNKNTSIVTKGRHDPCVGIRATPIAEAMLALVLCDLYLRDKAQNSN